MNSHAIVWLVLTVLTCISLTTGIAAQTLDGSPYIPGKDANIDLYFGSWLDSEPYITHGTLIERDILTQGDPLNPPAKGAVLSYVNRFTHATLETGTHTEPVTLEGEQEILYILSGDGKMKSRGESQDLYSGICVLVPADCEFSLDNTGSEPLTMYLISEPIPDDFRPNENILVRDENTLPITSTNVHWIHIEKSFFKTKDGLGTLENVITIQFDPWTIGHPHSHNPGVEEAWTQVTGESIAFMGKQIRKQPVGTGYMIPPDGKTPHSNINTTDMPVKMFYFARYRDHEVRK